MKEKTTGKKRTLYYLILAFSVLLLTAATVLTVYFVVDGRNQALESKPPVDTPVNPDGGNEPSEPSNPDDGKEPNEPSEPSGGESLQFSNPINTVTVTSGYGFYHNQTLGWFYEHEGVDISAEAGSEVLAMAAGTVESVTSDELTGTQIVLSHGDGLKTLYRFVNADEAIKVGATVEKGQKIATVSEPTGAEYKDGAHLHLEVWLNGANVDPTEYLTLDEK